MQRQNTGARRLPFVLLALLACGALAKGDTIVFRYGDTNALAEGYTGVTDTMLLGGVKTNLDYGGADDVHIGRNTWGNGVNFARPLMRWNLGALAGRYRSIQSVTLELTVQIVRLDAANRLDVYAVAATNRDWVAGTGNGTAPAAGSSTWVYRRHDTQPWAGSAGCSTAGTDYEIQKLGSAAWSTLTAGQTVSVSFTNLTLQQLTALVDQWSGDQRDNPGILLRAADETSVWYEFNSSDYATLDARPALTITYTPKRLASVVFCQGATNTFVDGYTGMTDNMLCGRAGYTTRNFGGYHSLYVGATSWGNTYAPGRSLLRWDLSSMRGRYRSIASLTLRLYSWSVSSGGSMTVHAVSAANTDWYAGTHASGGLETGASCWDYRVSSTDAWAGTNGCGLAGSDFATDPLASLAWKASTTGIVEIALTSGPWAPDALTALVDSWAGDPSGNAGLLMRASASDEAMTSLDAIVFRSAEATDPSQRPQLVIEYELLPGGTIMLLR